MPSRSIPFIPDDAPFTPEQRAWLNGFLAGLYSGAPAGGTATSAKTRTLTLLVASQTGTGDALARAFAKDARARGYTVNSLPMDQQTPASLAEVESLFIIASTHGEGEPPDNARTFYDRLHAADAPRLERLRFGVLALGDSNYEHFAKCGKDFDARLAALGATRLAECACSDVDVDEPFERWKSSMFVALDRNIGPAAATAAAASPASAATWPASATASPASAAATPGAASNGSAGRKFASARLVTNALLNGSGSGKETRHIVLAADDATALVYEPGDALGVVPQNCPRAITKLLGAVGFRGDEPVPDGTGGTTSLHTALRDRYSIGKLTAPAVRAFAAHTGDPWLQGLLGPENTADLAEYLHGREMLDLFSTVRGVSLSPTDFVAMLGKLTPRLFSIASSPSAHASEVHLTVSIVRYHTHHRERKGVCSTFLADRVAEGSSVPVYVQRNTRFRLPGEGERRTIMVGPGTGIAPFRAFLHERRALGATGNNWLFFGDRNEASDYLYRDELEAMLADGYLTHLHTAFSRDQSERIYVQQRMHEAAKELYAWLEDGAHFYVCGDATQMAKDVDAALHAIVSSEGGLGADDAAAYVEALRTSGRYQRDVY